MEREWPADWEERKRGKDCRKALERYYRPVKVNIPEGRLRDDAARLREVLP